MRTLVIAEIGACHDGEVEKMIDAIEIAAACDAGVIKFQWTSDPRRMARRRGRAEADGYAALYAKYLGWPAAWHADLADRAAAAGIEYACTVYLPEDVAIVAPHVRRFKVASFEARDDEHLLAHVSYGKPVLVSVGMMDDGEAIGGVRGLLKSRGADVRILQCVSAYPAPVEALNLALLRERYDGRPTYDGLSDHTDPALTWTGALAVAAGAEIVEAHLRLDSTRPDNPDYPHAMTPEQFAGYTKHIRFAEACMGDGVKRLEPCERPMAQYRVGETNGSA